MEPFTPDDPLWKLMGKARPVILRPNFAQNVLRAARQESQDTGWRVQLSEWLVAWRRPLLSGLAATAVVLVAGVMLKTNTLLGTKQPEVAVISAAEMAVIADDVSAPLESLDHMDALVAMEDTSTLTDTELQFLLY